jgi:hypothetical protein
MSNLASHSTGVPSESDEPRSLDLIHTILPADENLTVLSGELRDHTTGTTYQIQPSSETGRVTIRKDEPGKAFAVIEDSMQPVVQVAGTLIRSQSASTRARERALEEHREYSALLRRTIGDPFEYAAERMRDTFDPDFLEAALDEYFESDGQEGEFLADDDGR